MGVPYLESGESIVLTTDRVSCDTARYQALLTTRRLILIDSSNSRADPRIITLPTVRTVRSGKAATGDPVILLTLGDEGEPGGQTLILIFSQEPTENRRPDRDLWLKTFIELSVSSRDAGVVKEVPAAEGDKGIRPQIRRWVAPDITRPRTDNFPVKETEPAISVTPDEEEPAVKTAPEPVAAKPPAHGGNQQGEERDEVHEELLVRSARTAVRSLAAQEPEAPLSPPGEEHRMPELPADAVSSPAEIRSPVPEPDASLISASILAAVKSLTGDTGTKTPLESPENRQGMDPYPDIPVRLTSPLPENPEPLPGREGEGKAATPPPDEEAGPAGSLPTGEVLPSGVRSTSQLPELPPEQIRAAPQTGPGPDAGLPEPAREPEPPLVEMEPPDQIPEVQETSGGTEASPEIPAAPQTGDHPGTPFQNPAYGGRVLLVAGGLLLLILLISTGVFFLQDQHPPDAGQAVTPVPSQTTAIQITPTVTGTTATVPVNGTWVRILSPGSFIGQAGNPDSLAEVAGSGERWFRVRDSTGLVRVTVEKQDYSGNELRVQIYSEGRLVFSRSTSAPQGTVDLLIDPATGEAPGMRETPGTTSTGRGIQYL